MYKPSAAKPLADAPSFKEPEDTTWTIQPMPVNNAGEDHGTCTPPSARVQQMSARVRQLLETPEAAPSNASHTDKAGEEISEWQVVGRTEKPPSSVPKACDL